LFAGVGVTEFHGQSPCSLSLRRLMDVHRDTGHRRLLNPCLNSQRSEKD
jgi:hypothetical protein